MVKAVLENFEEQSNQGIGEILVIVGNMEHVLAAGARRVRIHSPNTVETTNACLWKAEVISAITADAEFLAAFRTDRDGHSEYLLTGTPRSTAN